MMTIRGADTKHFSGISARKGGLNTAITAGVTEEIQFLQSGHGQASAALNYIHLQDPARRLDTETIRNNTSALGLSARRAINGLGFLHTHGWAHICFT
jgi:hypothetical protein